MKERKKILFKVKGEVVVEDTRDLLLDDIEKMKWVVAEECECMYDDVDVEVETIKASQDLSEYDVSEDGLYNWKDPYFNIITGVTLVGDMDDLLDCIGKKYRDKYLQLS